jgi:hypothetical protein
VCQLLHDLYIRILLAQRSKPFLQCAPVFRVRLVLGTADRRRPSGGTPCVQCLKLCTAQGVHNEGVDTIWEAAESGARACTP